MSKQVAGDHYSMEIPPVEYITRNNLDFNRGNIVKYVSRDKRKNRDEDIKKVIDYALIILEYDYGYTEQQIAEVLDKFRPKEVTFKDAFINMPKVELKNNALVKEE